MTNDKTAKMLERVRALLAKAESTTFPAEADSLRAKADELMTTYAIDQWMVERAQAGVGARVEPERRDFDRSWAGSKFRYEMFDMFSAVARHCRCVVGTRGQTARQMPVFGLASDLDYLDMLYTHLSLEVAKNLQPPVSPEGELGEEVFKQRQAGIAWPEITRKVYLAGLVALTKGEFDKLSRRLPEELDVTEVTWSDIERADWGQNVRQSVKNRLANANRKYVRDHGLAMERNYVKPEVYQRSFMLGFVDEIRARLREMERASRKAYDSAHDAGSMALAVRDIRDQALALYEQAYPPPPPVEPDENAKPTKLPKLREVAYSYEAMSAGRRKAREADLMADPGRGVSGGRGSLPR